MPADIATTSAGLLFSEPPTFTVGDSATQARLDEITEAGGVANTLLEAAEVGAALGGVFLRVTWDAALAPRSLMTAVHADAAAPEFRWGQLSAVTFWRELTSDTNTVWRHLERREVGRVLHGLCEGTVDTLGTRVPLTEHPDTTPLADALGAEGRGDGHALTRRRALPLLRHALERAGRVLPPRHPRRGRRPEGLAPRRTAHEPLKPPPLLICLPHLPQGSSAMVPQLLEAPARTLVDHGAPDDPRCGRTPAVPPEMTEAVRAILDSEGGTASSDTSCLRHPDHVGTPHYSLLADLGAKDGGAWTLWQGPNLLLVLLPWCTAREDEPCALFDRHPGQCPPQPPT